MGHLNNVAYLRYLEWARQKYWLGDARDRRLLDIDFVVARAEIDYRSVRLTWARSSRSRSASRGWAARRSTSRTASRRGDGRLVAEAKTTQVCYDWDARAAKPLSPRSAAARSSAFEAGLGDAIDSAPLSRRRRMHPVSFARSCWLARSRARRPGGGAGRREGEGRRGLPRVRPLRLSGLRARRLPRRTDRLRARLRDGQPRARRRELARRRSSTSARPPSSSRRSRSTCSLATASSRSTTTSASGSRRSRTTARPSRSATCCTTRRAARLHRALEPAGRAWRRT